MQDPEADTEWNDVLRAKGILPPKEKKEEITEDDIVNMLENTIEKKTQDKAYEDMTKDELEDIEDDIDEEDERMFEMYRRQRMLEMMAQQKKSMFGSVLEISKADWVDEVNKAGDSIWVIVHVYSEGLPHCKLINQHVTELAAKFPTSKFVKGRASVCIPNYPDKNLPTIFVYKDGDLKKQWIGSDQLHGMSCKCEDLEWMLGQVGAIPTEMDENPRKQVHDVMQSNIRSATAGNDDDEDDW
ncbi:phosducin-like protein 3 [Watersipora subatra]|uniref:phosducin-like protein 3 n=1 Tax=Watersipora subatra TaxID=2589382 RepID=UPI00355B82D4